MGLFLPFFQSFDTASQDLWHAKISRKNILRVCTWVSSWCQLDLSALLLMQKSTHVLHLQSLVRQLFSCAAEVKLQCSQN